MSAPVIFPPSARVIVGGPNIDGEYRITVEGLTKPEAFKIVAKLLSDHVRAQIGK